ETLDFLKDEKLTRLDNYILTDYNDKMPDAVYKLLSNVKISNVYVPKPIAESERAAFFKLFALKETFDVNIVSYISNSTVKFKSFSFVSEYRDENYGIFKLNYKNKKYLIASSGILDSNVKNLAISEIYKSDYVIFSRHGKSYKNYSFVYEFRNPKIIISSSKGMYISDYTLSYYKKSGAEIYLTPEKYDFIR
ncbi:MAG: hypothetical protein IJW38_03335, partial [Clostridia bacterium]|nr:hypothetical protein [Clostridia bacterium]